MAGNGHEDFESLARRYWGAWGDAMRAAAGAAQAPGFGVPGAGPTPFGGAGFGAVPGFGAPPPFGAMPGFGAAPAFGGFGVPGFGAAGPFGATAAPADPGTRAWREAVDWWSRFAQPSHVGGEAVVERFNAQVRDWFGQMQQVAARFAGQQPAAAEVVGAWKEALGHSGSDPFGAMFRDLSGAGQIGFDEWFAQVEPFLAGLRGEAKSWLHAPTVGFTREHQARLQRLATFQIDYQQGIEAYNVLIAESSRQAFDLFEAKLQERAAADTPVDSARALFDLWIDAAEDAYAKVAMSPEFRTAYGRMVNTQMRLRGAVQSEVEHACALLGMPTRTELDSAHRKINELERTLRRQQRATRDPAAAAANATAAGTARARSAEPPAAAPGPVPKPRRTAKKKAAASKSATPRRAPGREASAKTRKPAARKAAPARAARHAAPQPARRAPTNGFTSLIPVAPVPLAPSGKPAAKSQSGAR